MDASEEVARGFVIARGYCSELFEFTEEILDQAARFIEIFVVRARLFAVGLRWDDGLYASLAQRPNHALVSIEGLIREQGTGLKSRQKRISACQIMRLSGREMEAGRIAQRIHYGVNFRAQSAFAAADCLVLVVFFCAPALC